MMALPDLGKRPLIMGILNLTPDSFSGDGLMQQSDTVAAALKQAEQMIADGATLLDIGGESSRPGHEPITVEEEIRRTAPVITALHKRLPSIPLSIDTVKADVARAAIDAGACIINDISGGMADEAMLQLAAQRGAWMVLMHNRSEANAVNYDKNIGGEYKSSGYDDVVADVLHDLGVLANRATAAGIAKNHIILDAGLGFGKSVRDNLRLMNEMDRFNALGFPILAGPSRKSFIGRVLDLPPEERLEGTAAAVAVCVLHCASIIRVHDVKEMARVVQMVYEIKSASSNDKAYE